MEEKLINKSISRFKLHTFSIVVKSTTAQFKSMPINRGLYSAKNSIAPTRWHLQSSIFEDISTLSCKYPTECPIRRMTIKAVSKGHPFTHVNI